MSLHSVGIRVFFLALVLATSFTTSAISADPKIVRTSHEADAKVVPQETRESKEAVESNEDEISYSPQWPEPPNTGAMLLRLCVGTVVVLALCVGTIWFGKPWLQRLKVAGAGTSALYIEGSVAVGNRAMLYLVRVGETQLIAGTDATGLKSLIAIPASFKDVLEERIPEVEAAIVAPTPQFAARAANRPDSKE